MATAGEDSPWGQARAPRASRDEINKQRQQYYDRNGDKATRVRTNEFTLNAESAAGPAGGESRAPQASSPDGRARARAVMMMEASEMAAGRVEEARAACPRGTKPP